ncbi:MAG: hypothetical protein ACTSU6_04845 [Candidatus Njordarchaeales archaeon]
MKPILIKLYENRAKSIWFDGGHLHKINNKKIDEVIRNNSDSDIFCTRRKTGEDVSFRILMELIMAREDFSSGDVGLMNRIIRSGGFIDHIKSLEASNESV